MTRLAKRLEPVEGVHTEYADRTKYVFDLTPVESFIGALSRITRNQVAAAKTHASMSEGDIKKSASNLSSLARHALPSADHCSYRD